MSTYPFKLRLVRRGEQVFLEELAPSRGGSYFVKERLALPQKDLISAAKATSALKVMGLGAGPELPIE